MNFKVLNGDIYFSEEFINLNTIRGKFLEEAFKSTTKFTNECSNKFTTIEQLLKDGESFGYDYLDEYISRAIEILKNYGVDNLNNDDFIKKYYLDKYYQWGNTLEQIKDKNIINEKEDNKENTSEIILNKLNINSELIKRPFNIKEKSIILSDEKINNGISVEIMNKLVYSMVESIFNINFALIDALKDNKVNEIAEYSNIDDINKSNDLVKSLLKDEIPKEKEIETVKEIILLNPYNENIYKALLYKYGDNKNQIEKLCEFLGYNNFHEYKYKLLDDYYKKLNISSKEEVIKAKESIIIFANKLNIKDYSEYIHELNKEIKEYDNQEETIEIKTVKIEDEPSITKRKNNVEENKSYKKPIIIIGSICTSLLAIYLLMVLYFNSHFFFRTSINNINISGKSNKSAQDIIESKANEFVLKLEERNELVEEINGEDISLKYDFNDDINEILDKQNPFLWITSLFKASEYTITDGISYDELALKEKVGNLSGFKEENIQEPVDAYIEYNGNDFEIIKEQTGNKINYDDFYKNILENIENIDGTLNLDDKGCYEAPKYTSESKEVINAKDTIDKYMKSKITYNINGNEEIIDYSIINGWINIDEDFNVILNEDSVREYVDTLGAKYDNLGSYRDFTRWSGENIKVSTTPGIYYINRNQIVPEIIEAVSNGSEEVKDLSLKTPTATDDYIINTFVEINLTNQTIVFYKNGKLITSGNVVTGNVSQGNATPAGVYKLDWKAKDTVLRGDGYASPVSFWMPFNGGIGLHDATWRSSFGGNIYKTNGSHGCVNLPYSVAEAIYYNIEEKTTIICRY